MTETTPGRSTKSGTLNSAGTIALSDRDTPKDYSKPETIAASKSSSSSASTQPNTSEQDDLEEIGTTVLHLSQGKLTIEEPSYRTLRDCRIACARWAADNPDISQADPGIAELEYVVYLCIASTTEWQPTDGPVQTDLNKAQFEEFSASDFRKVTGLMRKYAGNSAA